MIDFIKTNDYLVCVDSDGTVMDSMTLKHRKVLAPKVISVFKMEAHKREILKKWYELNLYKETRGLNRFIALDSILRYAAQFGYNYEGYNDYHNWVLTTKSLSVKSLEEEISNVGSSECMEKALRWGKEVNEKIAKLPLAKPFKNAYVSIEILSHNVDLLGVSSANEAAITEEWRDAKIDKFFKAIGCQKDGTKEKIISEALSLGYEASHVLMLGDSIGDLIAAKENGILFFPFIPYHENESWTLLVNEGLNKFITGSFDREYQDSLIERFRKALA